MVLPSSCESEYRAIANASAEAQWVSHLVHELRLPSIIRLTLIVIINHMAHKRAEHYRHCSSHR